MIIGLTGYAQSGKDTLANILVEQYGFKRVAFADPIRDFCYEVNPVIGHVANEDTLLRTVVDRDGWETAKQNQSVRRLLQNVGVAARNQFGELFWVAQALSPTKISEGDKVVITDVRFVNEAEAIKMFPDSQLWRVKRPGYGPVNNHVSESEMEDYKVDQIFYNAGTIEDLRALVNVRMRAYV